MTSIILYLLEKQPWFFMTSHLTDKADAPQQRERNKLKKPPPIEAFYSRQQFLNIIRSPPFATLPPNHGDATVIYQESRESQPCRGHPPMKLVELDGSINWRPQNNMNSEGFRRTRAKTPILRIGQLEGRMYVDTDSDVDVAVELARQYQTELPSRGFTPCSQLSTESSHRNGLRRVKCRSGLRDIVNGDPESILHSAPATPASLATDSQDRRTSSSSGCLRETTMEHPRRTSYYPRSRFLHESSPSYSDRRHSSDSETLLGSDTESPPISPSLAYASKPDLDAIRKIHPTQTFTKPAVLPDSPVPESEIGLQLCLDLLTNDLTTALYRQHPAEPGNRVSGLQILLMIEAYESLQQRLREETHVMEFQEEHVKLVDDTLDNWLAALHSIYETSVSRSRREGQDSVSS